jgi:signal transduction histidine kinase
MIEGAKESICFQTFIFNSDETGWELANQLAAKAKEGVEVRVGDEGVGIADVDAERVFDPFYTTRSGGTGLGLAVVEQVVRAHGGVVSLRARVGGGAEFVIWLPATQAVSAPAPRADREVARAR